MLTLLFTLLSALYDNGKRFTNHIPRFVFRAIVVAIISYFQEGNFILNGFQNATIFYLLFDTTLNLLEGRNWNYIGNTAIFDKFWNGSWKEQYIFKVIIFLFSITLKYIYNEQFF